MTVKEIIEGAPACDWKGLLKDFPGAAEPEIHAAFQKILTMTPDVYLLAGKGTDVQKSAISNRIIHYKDIFKLEDHPIRVPYLLFDGERALILVPSSPYSYITTRGLYYCLTEQGALLYPYRNQMVVMNAESAEQIVSVWQQFQSEKAGRLQRQVDGTRYSDYDALLEEMITSSRQLKKEAAAALRTAQLREPLIRDYIVTWFYMKKVAYVLFMMNRDFRHDRFHDDAQEQRRQAKANADRIEILSLSEMWHLPKAGAELPSKNS